MLSMLRILVHRELRLAFRRQTEVMTVLFFFVMVIALFPLGVGPDQKLLQSMGGGVIWVSVLLSVLLSLERMFTPDHQDGVLEQMLLMPYPVALLIVAKALAHWLIAVLPLVLISPILGVQYALDADVLWVLMASLLLGSPILVLIGTVGSALTLGLRNAGTLLALLILPLFIPVLIFGSGVVAAQQSGLPVLAHFQILLAMLLLAVVLTPWAAGSALRISIE